jgi:two-component system chemotaxis response regulator CheY
MTKSVLIIDDNDDFRETCRYLLADEGYDLWDAACPKDAYPILSGERFDLIVCDLNMPFAGGKEADEFTSGYEVGVRTIKELAHVYPDTPIVALSATPSSDLRRLAKYLDPIPAFPKPTTPDDLLDLFETLAMLNSPSQIQ